MAKASLMPQHGMAWKVLGAALMEIVVFWSLLFALQLRLIRLDRLAALLWAPYLGWVTFASWLNFTIWRLN